MEKTERLTPGGIVVFCEEIRHEVYGTSSFIGVFPGFDMAVSLKDMPITMPRFAMCIKYYEQDNSFPSYNRVEGYAPEQDEPFFSEEIDEDVIKNSRKNVTPSLPLCGFTLNVNFTSFKISSFGNLSIFVSNERERLRLGTLRISEDLEPEI